MKQAEHSAPMPLDQKSDAYPRKFTLGNPSLIKDVLSCVNMCTPWRESILSLTHYSASGGTS